MCYYAGEVVYGLHTAMVREVTHKGEEHNTDISTRVRSEEGGEFCKLHDCDYILDERNKILQIITYTARRQNSKNKTTTKRAK